MGALPITSGAECIAALGRVGYRPIRQKGSHVRLACPGKPAVTVPLHLELDRGTLRSILRTVEILADDFVALLR
jgi:predicted RNA binding protein YcfA (HicA-like mRNA interferase family)